jgi:putative inorganic carbon (HCO3(-)) transporter
MPLTAIVFWLIYFGGLCAAIVCPVVGVTLYIFVYHLNPPTQWWGESFAASGIRPALTVAIATLLGALLRRPRLENGARQFALPMILALLLFSWALLSLSWAGELSPRAYYLAEKLVKVAVFMLLLVRCVRRPAEQMLVMLAWIFGVAYIGYQAYGGTGYVAGGRLTAGLGGPDFAESSGLAVHLVASLPILGAMFFTARSWWVRLLLMAAGTLAVNAIIMTRTRNAVFGLLAMALLALFWLPRGYRLKGLLAMGAAALAGLQLTDPGWWARMRTIRDYQRDPSAAGRLVYWQAAWELALQEPFGIGLGQFESRVQEYTPHEPSPHSAHNTFLECLAETGFPGALLFTATVLAALLALGRLRRRSSEFPSDLTVHLWWLPVRFHLAWQAMALQCALVGYLACGMFTTRLWAEGFWILIACSCSLLNVAAHLRCASRSGLAAAGVEPSAEPAAPGASPVQPDGLAGAQPAEAMP